MNLLREKPIQSISITELCFSGRHQSRHLLFPLFQYQRPSEKLEAEMLLDFKNALNHSASVGIRTSYSLEDNSRNFTCLKDNADICTVTLGITEIKTLYFISFISVTRFTRKHILSSSPAQRQNNWSISTPTRAQGASDSSVTGSTKKCSPA